MKDLGKIMQQAQQMQAKMQEAQEKIESTEAEGVAGAGLVSVRLKGKGEQGPGGPGDGLVTIAIAPHSFFKRHDDDVRFDLPITLDEAVNGGKVRVPTVDGPVMMTLKPGTSGGTVLRLKGKGFTRKTGTRGDQLVTLEIQLPDTLDELAKRLDGWKDESDPRSKLGV
jgi:DnaJ-class molecular chaperone